MNDQLPSLASLPADTLLTSREAAEYLGVTASTVTDMISAGKMPGVRLPIRTGLRVRVDQLRKFIADNTLPRGGDGPDVNALRAESRRRDAADRNKGAT